MLSLRRGVVSKSTRPATAANVVNLVVEVDGDSIARPYVDVAQVGGCLVGDDVVVNTEAVDLGLGSGGRDVVLVNLTRGSDRQRDASSRHVMKLNYTPLQSGVDPVEPDRSRTADREARSRSSSSTASSHRSCGRHRRAIRSCASATCRRSAARCRARFSKTVRDLRSTRDMLCDHLTAAPAYGGEGEAMSTIGRAARGARRARLGRRGRRSGSRESSARARRSATAGWSRSTRPTRRSRSAAAPFSSPARRAEIRASVIAGISHHTRTVLDLLLQPVEVAIPEAADVPHEAERHSDSPRKRRRRRVRRQRPAGTYDGPRPHRGRAVLRVRAGGRITARQRLKRRSGGHRNLQDRYSRR